MKQSNSSNKHTSWFERDIALNLSFKESGIRAICGILAPVAMAAIHPLWIFYVVPFTVYMYITALSHFCPVKYLWGKLPSHKQRHTSLDWPADQADQIDPTLG